MRAAEAVPAGVSLYAWLGESFETLAPQPGRVRTCRTPRQAARWLADQVAHQVGSCSRYWRGGQFDRPERDLALAVVRETVADLLAPPAPQKWGAALQEEAYSSVFEFRTVDDWTELFGVDGAEVRRLVGLVLDRLPCAALWHPGHRGAG